MAKCARAHAALLKGPVCKCDQTRLIDKNRRTRNLAPSAWRCEHSATPSKFFQRDYSFRRQRPHFILKCAMDRTRLSRGCFTCNSCHNLLLSKYLTKVGNPKVVSLKTRRVGQQRLARCGNQKAWSRSRRDDLVLSFAAPPSRAARFGANARPRFRPRCVYGDDPSRLSRASGPPFAHYHSSGRSLAPQGRKTSAEQRTKTNSPLSIES